MLSEKTNDEVDNLDQKHDSKSKPETQHAADVWQQNLNRHRLLVLNNQRELALQHHVQLQKVFTDQRQQRYVLQQNRTPARAVLSSNYLVLL